MKCTNLSRDKYFCQRAHAKGTCAVSAVRKMCTASCSCPDDRYHTTPGRYATKPCGLHLFKQFPNSTQTLVVVNSNSRSPFAPALVHSLRATELPALVVHGNSNKTSIREAKNGVISMHVTHDSIDFTAMIALVDHYTRISSLVAFDRIFYMHDTMRVVNASAFKRAIHNFNLVRTCGLQMGQSMNIGIYAIRDLLDNTRQLRSLRGKDYPSRAERLRQKLRGQRGWEGIMFDVAGAWAKYDQCGCQLSKGPDDTTPVNITFKDSVYRRRELRYTEWGLSKFQSPKPTIFK